MADTRMEMGLKLASGHATGVGENRRGHESVSLGDDDYEMAPLGRLRVPDTLREK